MAGPTMGASADRLVGEPTTTKGHQLGLRQWFWDLLARGEAPEPDPNAQVEATVVPLFNGPMLVERLRAEGVDAEGLEAFDIRTRVTTQMRIMVRQRDLAEAREILEGAR
jgi:hypothetical protein